MPDPIPLGTKVPPFGEVSAVGWLGERCYWLTKKGQVSMLPASMLEPHVEASRV